MAAGRVAEAIPLFEEMVERLPAMSFPVSSLLRAHAFRHDWAAVDRLLQLAEQRQLREFQDGLPFIRAKRDPSPEQIGAWRERLEAHVRKTGSVDASRLVYAAHLGLVDEAYSAADAARLGPAGNADDILARLRRRSALRLSPCLRAGARRAEGRLRLLSARRRCNHVGPRLDEDHTVAKASPLCDAVMPSSTVFTDFQLFKAFTRASQPCT